MDEYEFAEYQFRSSHIQKQKADDLKQRLIASSYTAWQILSAQGLKTNWNDYLEAAGLVDKFNMGQEAKKRMVERAYAIAEKIRKSRHA